MCNNCPVNPVINLSTFFFPFKHLQDLICKMATIYEGLEKGIKKVLVINVLWPTETQSAGLLFAGCQVTEASGPGILSVDSPCFYWVPGSLLSLSTYTLACRMVALVLQCLLELCCYPVLNFKCAVASSSQGFSLQANGWVPFRHSKQGCPQEALGKKTTNPTVFLFSCILKYEMECCWAAVNERLWRALAEEGKC
jgi:hypothetical protein